MKGMTPVHWLIMSLIIAGTVMIISLSIQAGIDGDNKSLIDVLFGFLR